MILSAHVIDAELPSGATTLPVPSFGQKKEVTNSCCASSWLAHSSVQYLCMSRNLCSTILRLEAMREMFFDSLSLLAVGVAATNWLLYTL